MQSKHLVAVAAAIVAAPVAAAPIGTYQVTQTYNFAYGVRGGPSNFVVGGLNLAPNEGVTAATLNYSYSAFASTTYLILDPTAPNTFTASVSAGFTITTTSISMFNSTSYSGTCDSYCYAGATYSGTLDVSPFDLAKFGGPVGLIVGAGGSAQVMRASGLPMQTTSGGGASGTFTFQIAQYALPEPGSWALMIAGFGAVGLAMRRRAPRVLAMRA